MAWRDRLDEISYRIIARCSERGWPMNRTHARQLAESYLADQVHEARNVITVKLPSRLARPR